MRKYVKKSISMETDLSETIDLDDLYHVQMVFEDINNLMRIAKVANVPGSSGCPPKGRRKYIAPITKENIDIANTVLEGISNSPACDTNAHVIEYLSSTRPPRWRSGGNQSVPVVQCPLVQLTRPVPKLCEQPQCSPNSSTPKCQCKRAMKKTIPPEDAEDIPFPPLQHLTQFPQPITRGGGPTMCNPAEDLK
jgi:hypothetical protein